MIAYIENIHFLRPAWLLLFLPLLYLVRRLARHDPGKKYWENICEPALIPFIVINSNNPDRRSGALLFLIAGALSILALSGPTAGRTPQPIFREQSALVLILDLSTSMLAQDVKPTRLNQARFRIADLLRTRSIGQTALIVFAAQAFAVTPLTDDVKTIDLQLPVLAPNLMPRQGKDVPGAIQKGVELLRQAGFGKGHLLLITDGVAQSDIAAATHFLGAGDYRLSVLGVGTEEGSPIPLEDGGFATDPAGGIVLSKLTPMAFQDLAHRGRGIYVNATQNKGDTEKLIDFFQTAVHGDDSRANNQLANQWDEIGPWLLLPVLILSALAFRRGTPLFVLSVLFVMNISLSPDVQADWFLTRDQAAQAAYQAGKYLDAAEKFDNTNWRAASQYRAEKYEDMVNTLKHAKSENELYNRGNALARLGRLEDAIDSYDQVLKLNPGDADAAYNRALLQKSLDPQKGDGKPAQHTASEGEDKAAQENPASESQKTGSSSAEKPSPPADSAEDPKRDPPESKDPKHKPDASTSAKSADARAGIKPDAEKPENQKPVTRDVHNDEKNLSTEQWIRQIPDDPGGLLRKKFLTQFEKMNTRRSEKADQW